jgi:adenosine deaminase
VNVSKFIRGLPKAELHLHIEGTFEPELLFSIAKRNKIPIKYSSVSALRKAYDFGNLQDFLDIYYEGCNVLLTKKDFYDLTFAYFSKAHSQGIRHVEFFFDPQTHTSRGVPFSAVIGGIHKACMDAQKKYSISSKLIMCFLRHLPQSDAEKTLKEAIPYKRWIAAVGLDSSEVGNPPSKFARVFSKARKAGFLTVAHAGEEGRSDYVKQAISLLKVSRVDHGNHALDDPVLVRELVKKRIPLTVCPLSNLKLQVVKDIKKHPLKKMMDSGLLVCINSDDPAYFGGYLDENYQAVQNALNLSRKDMLLLAKNSFESSFLSPGRKKHFYKLIESYRG